MQYPPAPPPDVKAEVARDAPPAAGTLWRDQVVATVDHGLGSFLQHVDLEPSLEDGHFTGFRIASLIPTAYWEGVGLQLGDVVTRVNNMPIERETEAYNAFEALRQAPELRVSYLRAGKPNELVFKIVDRHVEPAPAPAGPSAPPPSAGAPSSSAAAKPAAEATSSVNVTTPVRAVSPDVKTPPPKKK